MPTKEFLINLLKVTFEFEDGTTNSYNNVIGFDISTTTFNNGLQKCYGTLDTWSFGFNRHWYDYIYKYPVKVLVERMKNENSTKSISTVSIY